MTMTRPSLLLLAGLLFALPVRAQSGDAAPGAPYFHTAARHYLDGALPRALATVNEGLRTDPDNTRLQALRAKIEQQRPPSDEDDAAEQNPPDEDPSSQPNRDEQQNQNAGPSEQEDASADQAEQDEQGEEDERAPNDPAQNAPSGGGTGEAPPSPEEGGKARDLSDGTSLSPAEAARILRALENQEKQLLRQVQKRAPRSRHIEKEW